jgi:small subunit ribosomal protein S4
MARYTGADCRQCRREGIKLFLKGDRCYTDKCAVERRPYPPGMAGKKRPRDSEYRVQLREKQKTKRLYGMLEGQFALTFDRASHEKGVVGETLLSKLERRLDNVVYRLGFGGSRAQARQLVRHGHIRINEKKLDIPSFQVRQGDVVSLSNRAAKNALVAQAVEAVKGRGVPKWLELDAAAMKGKVLSMPARDDVNFPIQEQLIVELYSK